MSNLSVQPLGQGNRLGAYVLERLDGYGLSLSEWDRGMEELARDRGGALVAVAASGLVQALATYRIAGPKAALRVQKFVVYELSRSSARRALAEGLRRLAADQGCAGVDYGDVRGRSAPIAYLRV